MFLGPIDLYIQEGDDIVKFNPSALRAPRIGQIHVDMKRYAADPESVLREINLRVKDHLDDDKSVIEIIVTNVRGSNT